jgi:acyl dehydratase
MLVLEQPSDLADYVGQELGVSDWRCVSQDLIARFAELTGDRTWIHTDPVRAARELPGGSTIAHGYLTLSLAPALMGQIYEVKRLGRIYNYGADRLRFMAPVPSGGRIRLRLGLKAAEQRSDRAIRFTFTSVLEVEHNRKPAALFEMLVLMYPPGS